MVLFQSLNPVLSKLNNFNSTSNLNYQRHESPLCNLYSNQKSDIGTVVGLGKKFNLHLWLGLFSDHFEIFSYTFLLPISLTMLYIKRVSVLMVG